MIADRAPLLALAAAYLALLFLVAWLTDRSSALRPLARHPAVYSLALGVYASTWTYFGSVGFAKRAGLAFLAVYLGPTLAALLAPAVGVRLLRLTRDHQLASPADLFAFRFQSRAAGALVTVAAIVASLPYIAQQIRAVVDSIHHLAPVGEPATIALGFSAMLALFAVMLGARHASARGAQDGLVVAIALESVVKLAALLAVGFAAVASFGGFDGLSRWLDAHPAELHALHAPVREGGTWPSLIVVAFASSFLLPRQFHVAFAEGTTARAMRVAAWGFPLYLLVLNLPILPILWAGARARPAGDADRYVLDIAQGTGSHALAAFAFVGGVSAASAMVVVTTLALSAMALHHIVLSTPRLGVDRDLYAWLRWLRRGLVVVIVAAGYGTFLLLEGRRGLVDPGVVSFVAFAQFLPGVVGVLAWHRATARGFVAGLSVGLVVWGYAALAPLLGWRAPASASEPWTIATFTSLAVNALVFAIVSLSSTPSPEEAAAADVCVRGTAPRSSSVRASDDDVADIRARLGALVGSAAAESEIERAKAGLGESPQVGALAQSLERNLTAMVGPLLARMIVDASARAEPTELALADQLRFLDERLKREGARLDGVAAELDRVRRYLSTLLDELPLGACAIDATSAVALWNRALERLTGLASVDAVGRAVAELPAPWGEALASMVAAEHPADTEIRAAVGAGVRALRVHATRVGGDGDEGGVILLIEDVTDRRALESKVAHQDRLASVGRLAAGVAHEIGNPLTGIACVAQNLRDDRDPELAAERVEDILEQTRRIEAIVRSLLVFSHAGVDAKGASVPSRIERISARALCEEALRLVRLDRTVREIACESRCDDAHEVLGDRRALHQVFVNLLKNAFDASSAGKHVFIDSTREGDRIRIRVRDEGSGIPDEVRARLFDPFVTTKAVGTGTGLGLSVAYGIVREHGGTISIDTAEGKGTTVDVFLPAATQHGGTA